MNSPKRLARMAGVLYLAVGIFGAFAEDFEGVHKDATKPRSVRKK